MKRIKPIIPKYDILLFKSNPISYINDCTVLDSEHYTDYVYKFYHNDVLVFTIDYIKNEFLVNNIFSSIMDIETLKNYTISSFHNNLLNSFKFSYYSFD